LEAKTAERPLNNPFEAVPQIADDVETRRDSKGRAHLRRTLPLKLGLLRPIFHKLGYRRRIHVDLDEQGTLFWDFIDGTRCLRDIEQHLRTKLSCEREESEAATLTFTKMLMLRHLMYLRVPAPETTEEIHATGRHH
jgi:hypothetical protein